MIDKTKKFDLKIKTHVKKILDKSLEFVCYVFAWESVSRL